MALGLAQVEEQLLLGGGGAHLHQRPRAQHVFLDRGADPPHRIGRQAEALVGLEALDRLHQPDIAFGNDFGDRQAIAAIAHGDLGDEPIGLLSAYLLSYFRRQCLLDAGVKRFASTRASLGHLCYAVDQGGYPEYILRSWSLVKMGTTANQKKLFFNLRKTKSRISALDEATCGSSPCAG